MRYFNKDEQKTTINEAHYDNDDGDCDGVIDLRRTHKRYTHVHSFCHD